MKINRTFFRIALIIFSSLSTILLHTSEQSNKVAIVRMPWFADSSDRTTSQYDGDEPVKIKITLPGGKQWWQVFKLVGCEKKFFWLLDKQLIKLGDEYEDDCAANKRAFEPSSKAIISLADYAQQSLHDTAERSDSEDVSSLEYEGCRPNHAPDIASLSIKLPDRMPKISHDAQTNIPDNTVEILATTRAYSGEKQLRLSAKPHIFSVWAVETEGHPRRQEILDPYRVTTVFAHALSKSEGDDLLKRIQKIYRDTADTIGTIQGEKKAVIAPHKQSICEQLSRMITTLGKSLNGSQKRKQD